jgi:hypothetical protein
MAPTDPPAVRLTVWRPVRWSRRLLDAKEGRPVDPSCYHESVYRWDMQENPLDAVTDPALSQKIDECLFQGFQPERSPEERSIDILEAKASVLDDEVRSSAGLWMSSEQRCPSRAGADDDAAVCLRQNRLLAFRQVLQWVCDTFRSVPGACVTLR